MPPKKATTATRRQRESNDTKNEPSQNSQNSRNNAPLSKSSSIASFSHSGNEDSKVRISGDVTEITPALVNGKKKNAAEVWACAFSDNTAAGASNDFFLALAYLDSHLAVYRNITSEVQSLATVKPTQGSIVFSKSNPRLFYVASQDALVTCEIKMLENNKNNNSDESGATFAIELVSKIRHATGTNHLPVTCVAISPCGTLLLASAAIYNIEGETASRTPKFLKTLKLVKAKPELFTERHLEAYPHLRESQTLMEKQLAPGAEPPVGIYIMHFQALFSPDSKSVFASGPENTLVSYSVDTGEPNRPSISLVPREIFEVAKLGFGGTSLCTREEKSHMPEEELKQVVPLHSTFHFYCRLAMSPDGQTIVAGAMLGNHQVQIVDVTKWERVPIEQKFPNYSPLNIAPHTAWLHRIAFHPVDQSIFATTGFDFSVAIWSLRSGLEVARIRFPPKSEALALAFSTDGRWMCASMAKNSAVQLFRIEISE